MEAGQEVGHFVAVDTSRAWFLVLLSMKRMLSEVTGRVGCVEGAGVKVA